VTEESWNTTSSLTREPHSYSKTLAEREAWRIAQAQDRWCLVTINPGLVIGPALSAAPTSEAFAIARQMASGQMRFGAPPHRAHHRRRSRGRQRPPGRGVPAHRARASSRRGGVHRHRGSRPQAPARLRVALRATAPRAAQGPRYRTRTGGRTRTRLPAPQYRLRPPRRQHQEPPSPRRALPTRPAVHERDVRPTRPVRAADPIRPRTREGRAEPHSQTGHQLARRVRDSSGAAPGPGVVMD
jgi:hypothetical protein